MGRLRGFYASMVGKKAVMGVTGLIGVGFVVFHSLVVVHILHFTTGTIRPAGVFARGDVYGNVVSSFRVAFGIVR